MYKINMRKILTVLLLVFCFLSVNAQKKVVQRSRKCVSSAKVVPSQKAKAIHKKAKTIHNKESHEDKTNAINGTSYSSQTPQVYQQPVIPQYSFGIYKINKKLYIQNLKDNVSAFIEYKRNNYGWTIMQVREFHEAFNDFISAMEEDGRLSTDEFGTISDSKGLLSNTDKYDYWYDKHGNCITNDRYNSLKDKKKKKYEQFEANRQVVSFAQEIGKGLIETLRKEHKL